MEIDLSALMTVFAKTHAAGLGRVDRRLDTREVPMTGDSFSDSEENHQNHRRGPRLVVVTG